MTTPAPLPADPDKEYTKRYKTVVPIPVPDDWTGPPLTTEDLAPGAREGHRDILIARWLGRESFENKAAEDRLKIVEYSERIIQPADVDPRLAEHLGPLDRFIWFEFSGVGKLDVDAFNYFAAEFTWNCEQWLAKEAEYADDVDAWLKTEREHQGANPGGG